MSLIQMSTTSPSPPSSQPIASSSSTTLAMLPPSSTQPSSKRQRKRGERCLGSFCTRPRALRCSRDLCLRHCREAGGCHFHGFHDGLPLHGDDEEVHDDFLIEQSEDGGFGREELRQALNASLEDLGLPIPDIPVPSIHDLISAPPAPIPRVQSPNVPFEADLSSSPVLPALPHTSSSRPMPKHPRITQQMDPIWVTDLRARAQQEADDKRIEERRKEMEREAKQRFVLHWFDSVSIILFFQRDSAHTIPRIMPLSRLNGCPSALTILNGSSLTILSLLHPWVQIFTRLKCTMSTCNAGFLLPSHIPSPLSLAVMYSSDVMVSCTATAFRSS